MSAITEPLPAPDTIALASATTIVPGADRADEYLTDTTAIYERTMPDGRVIVARISTSTYASVFGIEWRAPTGSADRRLGDRAVFLGEPGAIAPWGTAWRTSRWYDLPVPGSTEVAHSMSSTDGLSQYLLVRAPSTVARSS